jgi:hypothetical protein
MAAAKTPVITKGTAGFVEPGRGVWGGVVDPGTSIISNGKHHSGREDLKLGIFFFSTVDHGDTWTSNIPGVVATSWQADQPDTDRTCCTLIVAKTGQIEFSNGAAATGWCWVLSRA